MSGERVSLLDARGVAEGLAQLPGWAPEGKGIAKTWRFGDFKAAMVFVNGVAALAERANHHPDVLIHYNVVTLTLWSHDAGGLTARDLALATTIERVLG